MDWISYKLYENNLLDANKQILDSQDALTAAMTSGCVISYLIPFFKPEFAAVLAIVPFEFATGAVVSLITSLIKRYSINCKAFNYAINKSNTFVEASSNQAILNAAFQAEEVEPLNEEAYSEIYLQAESLREYIEAVNFEGAESLVNLLDSLMKRLQNPMSAERQEDYEIAISQIADCAYNKALDFYGMRR